MSKDEKNGECEVVASVGAWQRMISSQSDAAVNSAFAPSSIVRHFLCIATFNTIMKVLR